MAADIPSWIAKAIIKHDKEHGANLEESRTGYLCQLVKFTTFRTDQAPHAQIEGIISDKTHWVNVIFDVSATDESETSKYGLEAETLTSHLRQCCRIRKYRITIRERPRPRPNGSTRTASGASLARTESEASVSSRTGSGNGKGMSLDVAKVVLEILEWDQPFGSMNDPVYFEDKAVEVGLGKDDVEVQRVLRKWHSGESYEDDVPPLDPSAPMLDPSARPKAIKSKSTATREASEASSVLSISGRPRHTRSSLFGPIIAGANTKPLPDWVFDVTPADREILDQIRRFGMDRLKSPEIAPAPPISPEPESRNVSPSPPPQSNATAGPSKISNPPIRSLSPEYKIAAEPQPELAAPRTLLPHASSALNAPRRNRRPSSPPILSPPPLPASQILDVPIAPRIYTPPSPPPTVPAPVHTFPLPTPGQKFVERASSGIAPKSSLVEPTPASSLGYVEVCSNPDSVRLVNTQGTARKPTRAGFIPGGRSNLGNTAQIDTQDWEEHGDDEERTGSGGALSAESPIPLKPKKGFMMKRSRPSGDALLALSSDDDGSSDDEPKKSKKKKKKFSLSSSPQSEMAMTGEEEEEEGDGDEDEDENDNTDDSDLSDYERSRRRVIRSQRIIHKQSKSQSKPKDSARNITPPRRKVSITPPLSLSQNQKRPITSSQSHTHTPSQQPKQSPVNNSNSQSQTQQISSIEEAQRPQPHLTSSSVHPWPNNRTRSEKLRTPSKSLSASPESLDTGLFARIDPHQQATIGVDDYDGLSEMDDIDAEGEEEDEEEVLMSEDYDDDGNDSESRVNASLGRVIRRVRKGKGKALVVGSLESGEKLDNMTNKEEGRGMILVEDSEESAERLAVQAQKKTGPSVPVPVGAFLMEQPEEDEEEEEHDWEEEEEEEEEEIEIVEVQTRKRFIINSSSNNGQPSSSRPIISTARKPPTISTIVPSNSLTKTLPSNSGTNGSSVPHRSLAVSDLARPRDIRSVSASTQAGPSRRRTAESVEIQHRSEGRRTSTTQVKTEPPEETLARSTVKRESEDVKPVIRPESIRRVSNGGDNRGIKREREEESEIAPVRARQGPKLGGWKPDLSVEIGLPVDWLREKIEECHTYREQKKAET